jgi:hypothetical protein
MDNENGVEKRKDIDWASVAVCIINYEGRVPAPGHFRASTLHGLLERNGIWLASNRWF